LLNIDGSQGEGGGQIVRSSLSLSLLTGKPFRIVNIRAGRERPGLMRQHLTAVRAAEAVSGGEASGATAGSAELTFRPGETKPGEYRFDMGTAGSTTLVLQTVLPALMLAKGPSSLTLEGGTHNPFSPPFDFLAKAFLPIVNRMGPRIEAILERPGFYPAGGGRMRVAIEPAEKLERLGLLDRGEILARRARAIVAVLPRSIAQREVAAVSKRPGWGSASFQIEEVRDAPGPGNVVILEVESEHLTEVFTGFGEKGVPAETVAGGAADEAAEYLRVGVPVGMHLADQLLLPMALAGGGSFRTLAPTRHTETQAEVLHRFLGVDVRKNVMGDGRWEFQIGGGRLLGRERA